MESTTRAFSATVENSSAGYAFDLPYGSFRTNPRSDTRIEPGEIIIAIGTQAELDALVDLAGT